jgi:transglutaminase-like putative cysteine protease
MDRRSLLKAIPAASLLAAAPWAARAQSPASSPQGWRIFEVVTRLEITPPTGQVQAWVPLPLTHSTDWFETLSNTTTGNADTAQVYIDPVYGAGMVYARFKPGEAQPVVEVTSRFRTRDRFVSMSSGSGAKATPQELALYLKGTDLMPIDGIVRERAAKITAGASTDIDRARAVYDWVVENTERNPQTRGCGMGDVKAMLETGTLNGKCADLNALFVALCRAAGVPARDVYGIRVSTSPRGYRSMGPKPGDISKAQHCRAEFHAQGIGWIPVDPADVRKVVLEEAPGMTLSDDRVKQARSMLWGGWEGNWLGYNYGHDLRLPGTSRAPVAFLMYPQAENAQGRLDSLDPESFRYRITSREIA